MYKVRFLIISARKELSVKYKKLIDNLCHDAIISKNLSDALLLIQKHEIEFIIISDTIKEKLSEFIKKIRILTYNSRPVIIAVSKSSDIKDKLEILDSGADDFIGEEISKQEFQMRIKAHLRRYLESSINPLTHLLDKKITIKAINKSIFNNDESVYLLIKIKGIKQYRLTHGEIAYEKVLQTLGAIINSTLASDDFIGHIKEDELILITNILRAEKIAAFLVFAFDNILNKFYSSDEFENNFTIKSDDNIQETKDYLMRLFIAAIEKKAEDKDYKGIINSLEELIKLCDNSPNSTYVMDRIKLKGETSVLKKKNKVLIFEYDNALSYLLKNVCEINKIDAKLVNNEEEFMELYGKFCPDVVVLDWGRDKKSKTLEIAKTISKDNIKLIFSSAYLNKKEILKSGADLYLPKPYEINDIMDYIKKYLNDFP